MEVLGVRKRVLLMCTILAITRLQKFAIHLVSMVVRRTKSVIVQDRVKLNVGVFMIVQVDAVMVDAVLCIGQNIMIQILPDVRVVVLNVCGGMGAKIKNKNRIS